MSVHHVQSIGSNFSMALFQGDDGVNSKFAEDRYKPPNKDPKKVKGAVRITKSFKANIKQTPLPLRGEPTLCISAYLPLGAFSFYPFHLIVSRK